VASSNYRMNVIWSSQGAQLQRDINTFLGQLGQMEQRVGRSQQQMGLWGQQMRAIGTTIRYALAGAVVYSIATAISSLGDFSARLGEIDSLAAKMDSGGRLVGLGDNLRSVGDIALETSMRIGVSVDQIQQHMIGFYSAFDAPSGRRGIEQMTEFTNAMADLTLISEGADPQQLSRAVAAMARDVRTGGLRGGRAGDVGDLIAQILQTTPNIRGEDIARDLGRLSAARVASRMTPEEILGVYGQAAKAGGSAAVIGRGVSQLLTTGVISPRTNAEKEAFQRAVGTADPTKLRELGGLEILKRMMRAVAPGGQRVGAGAARILGSEDFTDTQALGLATRGGQLRGINMTLATQLFGRQESLRIFLSLLSQGGPQAMQDYIDSLKKGEKENVARQRADLVNQQRFWQRMQAEQQAIGISMASALEPAFRVLEHRVIRPVAEFSVRHPRAALGIAAGAGAGMLAARLGAFGAIGRRLPGGVGRMFARGGGLAALPAAAAVGAGMGGFNVTGMPTGVPGVAGAGSRTNPFWVVIDPMSWFLPGAPSGGGIGGGVPGTGAGGGGLGGFLRRQAGRVGTAVGGAGSFLMRRQLLRLVRAGALPVAVLSALAFPEDAGAGELTGADVAARRPGDPGFFNQRRHPFISRLMRNMPREHSRGTNRMLDRFASGDISANHFERWLRVMAMRNAQGRGDNVEIEGEAALQIGIQLNDDARRLLKVSAPEGIPVKLWPKNAPQHRGKNKSTRKATPPPGARGPVGG
jgi:hypothetical protein